MDGLPTVPRSPGTHAGPAGLPLPTGSRAPSAEEVREARLRRLQRGETGPFLEKLAAFLEVELEPAALQAWAQRNPDKWASAVAGLARIAGYATRTELDVSISLDVGAMSDSQLQEALAAQMAKLEQAAGAASCGSQHQLQSPDTSASSA